ncbi:peroxisomal assembly protein [Nowakowskiella sp. JEL0407]|nr:peroxisomal assembly protein [Nowakowskiella sp. JEL0407]
MCLPVNQGLMTVKSKIIILPPTLHPIRNAKSTDHANNAQLLNLTNTILDINRTYSDALYFTLENSDTINNINLSFSLSVLGTLPKRFSNEMEFDHSLDVFVSFEMLAKLDVFGSELLILENVKTGKSHVVRVFPVERIDGDLSPMADVIYLSPLLHFNLDYACDCRALKYDNERSVAVADSASVSAIPGKITYHKILLEVAVDKLKEWFEVRQRVVQKGDIIAVPLNENFEMFLFALDDDEKNIYANSQFPTNIAFFVVSELNSSTSTLSHSQFMTIDTKKTKLNQSGFTNSFIPKQIFSYFNITNYFHPQPDQNHPDSYNELKTLLLIATTPSINIKSFILLYGPSGVGKRTMVGMVTDVIGVQAVFLDMYDMLGDTEQQTMANLEVRLLKAVEMCPCVIVLTHFDCLVGNGNNLGILSVLEYCFKQVRETKVKFPVSIVATIGDELEKLPPEVQQLFNHRIRVESPSERVRLSILNNLTRTMPLSTDVSLKTVATKTASLVAKDLRALVSNTAELSSLRILETLENSGQIGAISDADVAIAGLSITMSDFNVAIEKARKLHSKSIGAPQIPNVSWEDVGGLSHVKSAVTETIQLPLLHPDLFTKGLKKRSGILLYGPPGTGKTLVAKAIATTFSLNFLSVKGPELLNMYVGESERNVRAVFQRARDASPCVIFFDELDSVAPKRGEKGDGGGGVMDRIVSQLLAELDGMGVRNDVFVVAATNRPDLIDPGLLRPGRFDKMLYLGISDTKEQQLNIVKALTRKFKLANGVDLSRVVEKCPFNYTGADFYALCSDAMLKAIVRTIESIEERLEKLNSTGPHPPHPHPILPSYYMDLKLHPKGKNDAIFEDDEEIDLDIKVTEEDFENARMNLTPSVSVQELDRYKQIRKNFEKEDD